MMSYLNVRKSHFSEYDDPSPVSFMAGSYDSSSPHIQAHQDQHYYHGYVQPPLGSDSSSYAVPQHPNEEQINWNNNEPQPSYDCY